MLKDLEEHLLTKVRAKGEQEVKQAEKEIAKQLKETEEKWKKEMEKSRERIKARLLEEERERLSWARLEERRMLAEAKEEVLDEAFEEFKKELSGFTAKKEYTTWLNKMIEKGLKELGNESGVIHVKKGDKKKVKAKKGVTIKEDVDVIGGVIIESKDGKIRIDLSIDAFVRQHEDEIKKELYKHIFS